MLHPGLKANFTLAFDEIDVDFQVLSFEGFEAISQPYRFELELVSERPDIDLESLLHKQAFWPTTRTATASTPRSTRSPRAIRASACTATAWCWCRIWRIWRTAPTSASSSS
jgi:hypothetical protein